MAAAVAVAVALAVGATLAVPAAAAAREQIKPSLECSCRSTQRAQDRFHLNCQSSGIGETINSGEGEQWQKTEKSTYSCAQAPGGGGGGEWHFAEVAGFGEYRLSARALAWAEAAAACEAQRAQLAALEGGEEELRALLRAFRPHASDRKELLWLGIRYFDDDKDFYTVRGQKMVQLPWRPDHPLIRKNQNCVCVDIDAKLHGPHGCSGKRRFFCKS